MLGEGLITFVDANLPENPLSDHQALIGFLLSSELKLWENRPFAEQINSEMIQISMERKAAVRRSPFLVAQQMEVNLRILLNRADEMIIYKLALSESGNHTFSILAEGENAKDDLALLLGNNQTSIQRDATQVDIDAFQMLLETAHAH